MKKFYFIFSKIIFGFEIFDLTQPVKFEWWAVMNV